MPLYTYRCENKECNNKIDKIVKMADRKNPRECDKCSSTMYHEEFTPGDSGSNLYFRGNWFATTKGY